MTDFNQTAATKFSNQSSNYFPESDPFAEGYAENIIQTPIYNITNESSWGVDKTASHSDAFDGDLSPLQAALRRRQQEIADKDAEEERKKDELRQLAKRDLERWYHERHTAMEHKRQTMKQEEDILRSSALEKSDQSSCDWAKVIRFLEFSQVSKSKRDITRMKACILHAKHDSQTRQ